MKLNILVAYPYFKKEVVTELMSWPRDSFRLIVDSGAFSAWNIGKKIEIDEYCSFLDSIECLRPFHSVQLDVIGNPEETYRNFITMKKRGYDTMPVFTRGDKIERLHEFYNYTDYIMLGGVAVGEERANYVKWFASINGKRKVHWLGFTDMDFIKQYAPESVDSSGWQSAGRYGNMSIYIGGGNLKSLTRTEVKKNISSGDSVLKRECWRIGVSPSELGCLLHATSWTGTAAGKVHNLREPSKGLAYFLGACAHVIRSHEVEKKIGTKIYLACSLVQQVQMLGAARKFLIERGKDV